jgi:hypothetical protein
MCLDSPILPYYVHRLTHTHTQASSSISPIVYSRLCANLIDYYLFIFRAGSAVIAKDKSRASKVFPRWFPNPPPSFFYLMMCSDQNRDHLLTTSQSECSALVSSQIHLNAAPVSIIEVHFLVN